MSSMYAKYLQEKTNDHIFETEKGYATYRYTDEKTVYIIDLYVLPDFRQLGTASLIADNIVAIARSRGCTTLLGSVVPSAKESTISLKVLLGYGMTLQSSANDFIVFKKGI
jgi:GNAT superfamily N-acetyltransferase